MKRFFFFAVILMVFTSLNIIAQDIELTVELQHSNTGDSYQDLVISIHNAKPVCTIYLYDYEKPSWKGGQPLQSVTDGISGEVRMKDIPAGKYYIVVVDADKNAAIKLIDVNSAAVK
jgi:hypothetical protein